MVAALVLALVTALPFLYLDSLGRLSLLSNAGSVDFFWNYEKHIVLLLAGRYVFQEVPVLLEGNGMRTDDQRVVHDEGLWAAFQ